MKIILTAEESEEYFYNALCNGLGYISSGYGLELHVKDKDYKAAKANLLKEATAAKIGVVCYEDVLMQVLKDGNKLTLLDEEGGEDRWVVTLDDVHKKVQEAPANHLLDMVNGTDDAVSADVILQSVFIGEVIFG
jgi:hypothetical protein